MDSLPCLWWIWLIISITFLAKQETQLLAHNHQKRPTTNVTKHLHFPSFHPSNPELKCLGNAVISEEKGVIQIPHASLKVQPQTYQVGRALYSSHIRLFDPMTLTPASFQTTFSFQFTNSTTNRSGNGLAFVIVPDEFTTGKPGPWLGIVNDACNHYKVFAVEFDTSHDLQFGDPNDDHVGINLGTIVSFKTANSSEASVSLHNHTVVHRVWITYDGYLRWITLHLGIDGDPKPSQPLLSSSLNLSPFLEEYMFVGFSASTGDSSQIHNIFSWNFSSTVPASLPIPSPKICHRNVKHQVSKYSKTGQRAPPSGFLIFVTLLGLCSLAFLGFYFSSQRNKSSSEEAFSRFLERRKRPMLPSKPRKFTFTELYSATQRFSRVYVLASDASGVLYRGTLTNGYHVAVRRFSTRFLGSSSSRFDWVRIKKRIGEITKVVAHPSLPIIRGWCCESGEAMIVYDHYQNGSLDRWLFGLGTLPWTWRFKLIKDIAEALSFLHSKQLAHGNLNTSTIFLDVNYRAVVGDYRLGFFSGESGRDDPVSGMRADVFGFGMLVLEIVTGKKEEEVGDEEVGLLGFVGEMHGKGEMVKVVDERLGDQVNREEASRVLKIGLSCATESCSRPNMNEVFQCLTNAHQ
ncbi:putative protein kinase RLK-Pelle-LRR-III family [Rosa chinensis]|uniref:Protein kinase domain-containing protein n=2 Tax=Rosa chinensis TaxID=74649 RepID=A0A2P6P7H5_ROSCH|nr:putative protein kinase RLK-Pelle-LRR-III family [Rosa chinensis]